MNKTIATYYAPVERINRNEEEKLIRLWEENWNRHDFETIILSEKDTLKSDLYLKFKEKAESFPTINVPGYEKATFMRWLAMSCQKEPMFMADYDCFIYKNIDPLIEDDKINLFDRHVPCLVYGHPEIFRNICEKMMEYETEGSDIINNRPHFSDMLWLKKYIERDGSKTIVHKQYILPYGSENWEKSKIVHYCNNKMINKKPRSLHIPIIEKTYEKN